MRGKYTITLSSITEEDDKVRRKERSFSCRKPECIVAYCLETKSKLTTSKKP